MIKKYILTEEQLERLLTAALRLTALESGGVDNWDWYGESIRDFIGSWVNEKHKDPNEEWEISDIAHEDLKLYKEIEE